MSRNTDGLPMLPPWLSEDDVTQTGESHIGYEAPVQNLPHDDLITENPTPKRSRFKLRSSDSDHSAQPERQEKRRKSRRRDRSNEQPLQDRVGELLPGQPVSEPSNDFTGEQQNGIHPNQAGQMPQGQSHHPNSGATFPNQPPPNQAFPDQAPPTSQAPAENQPPAPNSGQSWPTHEPDTSAASGGTVSEANGPYNRVDPYRHQGNWAIQDGSQQQRPPNQPPPEQQSFSGPAGSFSDHTGTPVHPGPQEGGGTAAQAPQPQQGGYDPQQSYRGGQPEFGGHHTNQPHEDFGAQDGRGQQLPTDSSPTEAVSAPEDATVRFGQRPDLPPPPPPAGQTSQAGPGSTRNESAQPAPEDAEVEQTTRHQIADSYPPPAAESPVPGEQRVPRHPAPSASTDSGAAPADESTGTSDTDGPPSWLTGRPTQAATTDGETLSTRPSATAQPVNQAPDLPPSSNDTTQQSNTGTESTQIATTTTPADGSAITAGDATEADTSSDNSTPDGPEETSSADHAARTIPSQPVQHEQAQPTRSLAAESYNQGAAGPVDGRADFSHRGFTAAPSFAPASSSVPPATEEQSDRPADVTPEPGPPPVAPGQAPTPQAPQASVPEAPEATAPRSVAPQAQAPQSAAPQAPATQFSAAQAQTPHAAMPDTTEPQPPAAQSAVESPSEVHPSAAQPPAGQPPVPPAPAPHSSPSESAAPESTAPRSAPPHSAQPQTPAPHSAAPESPAPQAPPATPQTPQPPAPKQWRAPAEQSQMWDPRPTANHAPDHPGVPARQPNPAADPQQAPTDPYNSGPWHRASGEQGGPNTAPPQPQYPDHGGATHQYGQGGPPAYGPAQGTGQGGHGPGPAPGQPGPAPGQGGLGPSLDNVPLRRAKKAPGSGWRKAVHHASRGAVNPGLSAEERRLQELVARIRQPVRGDYRIAVLSLKGGVGKTTTTTGIGSTFASIRGDRVIAVDANPDFGTLSQRVPLQTKSTVRDLLLDSSIQRYSDVRRHTSQSGSRLEVLASERDPAASEAFNEEEYRSVARILQRFYNIVLTDCGTGLMHSAMQGVLGLAHSLVLISPPAIDGARSAAATLDWLSLHGHDHLVRNAVVVINSPRAGSPNVGIQQLREYFLARCRAVHTIPFDPHMSEGAEIDLAQLQKQTKRAYVELAATVADDFATVHRRPDL